MSRPLHQPLPGTVYVLSELLGRGGHGEVYRGEHATLDKKVIVKVMHLTADEAPQIADRMRLEAQALARLKHKNLVEVIDTGVSADGHPFFVMEDDRGRSLAAEMDERGRLPAEEAVAIARDVLDGLAFVHDQGLVHRDMQPGNVLLCPVKHGQQGQQGQRVARILDFGLVKLLQGHQGQRAHELAPLSIPTAANTTVGTPHYMSTEQAKGLPLDARADIFSVGVMVYEMLCGRTPFADHKTLTDILRALVSQTPAPPSSLTGQAGPALDEVIAIAMHKERDQRYASAQAFAAALARAAEKDAAARRTWAATEVIGGELETASPPTAKAPKPAAGAAPNSGGVFQPGDRCADYDIVRLIGRGGMGEVYLATKGGQEFAIKVLSSRARFNEDVTDRFKREVQLLSYLDNVHVVRFYDAGVVDRAHGSVLWVALEYVEGRSMRDEVIAKGGTLSPDRIVRWGRQIAQGVHEAHKIKVTHRDLKPENVLLTQNDLAKVIDFGIAKFKNWGKKSTMNVQMGTLAYMAPEQVDHTRAEEIDERTDVYALGLVLHELATGKQPFIASAGGFNPQAIIMQKLTTPVPDVREMRPDFPEDVARIIARASALDPRDRFANMEELADALAAVIRRRADERRAVMLGDSDSSIEAPTDKLLPRHLPDPQPEPQPHSSTGPLPSMPTVPDRPPPSGQFMPPLQAEGMPISQSVPIAYQQGVPAAQQGAPFSAAFDAARTVPEAATGAGISAGKVWLGAAAALLLAAGAVGGVLAMRGPPGRDREAPASAPPAPSPQQPQASAAPTTTTTTTAAAATSEPAASAAPGTSASGPAAPTPSTSAAVGTATPTPAPPAKWPPPTTKPGAGAVPGANTRPAPRPVGGAKARF